MRTKGANTKINCWSCMITANGVIIHNQEYPTLSCVACDLGLTRNIINEIVNNRRKVRGGKYDTQYIIKKKVKEDNFKDEEVSQDENILLDNPCPVV